MAEGMPDFVAGEARGLKDQRSSRLAGPLVADADSGQAAPARTQSSIKPICLSGSGTLGGMRFSAAGLSICTSRLSAGLPGSSTGPFPPPARAALRLSSRNPAICLDWPWHFWQCSTKMGRISRSNRSSAGPATRLRATQRQAIRTSGMERCMGFILRVGGTFIATWIGGGVYGGRGR